VSHCNIDSRKSPIAKLALMVPSGSQGNLSTGTMSGDCGGGRGGSSGGRFRLPNVMGLLSAKAIATPRAPVAATANEHKKSYEIFYTSRL
jgi:hypothetical protein